MYKTLVITRKVMDFLFAALHAASNTANDAAYAADNKAKSVRMEAASKRFNGARRAAQAAQQHLNNETDYFAYEMGAISEAHPFV